MDAKCHIIPPRNIERVHLLCVLLDVFRLCHVLEFGLQTGYRMLEVVLLPRVVQNKFEAISQPLERPFTELNFAKARRQLCEKVIGNCLCCAVNEPSNYGSAFQCLAWTVRYDRKTQARSHPFAETSKVGVASGHEVSCLRNTRWYVCVASEETLNWTKPNFGLFMNLTTFAERQQTCNNSNVRLLDVTDIHGRALLLKTLPYNSCREKTYVFSWAICVKSIPEPKKCTSVFSTRASASATRICIPDRRMIEVVS
ncbi:hypothetical protein RF11_05666 [Thelohanellus kitauei]|uniref:Uncharacterized protein n=1 Tax=Thelohanellus kitauei TaxID=669202 RepID=A0A0C2NDD6_THEKT|nr:hypothetical protein RF11_05666 [Thelohanellus kitauei]